MTSETLSCFMLVYVVDSDFGGDEGYISRSNGGWKHKLSQRTGAPPCWD